MFSRKNTLFFLIQIYSSCNILYLVHGSQEVTKANYNKGDIDFIMMAPQMASVGGNSTKSEDILSTSKQQKKEGNAKNNTRTSILVRILQFKTFWSSDSGKNRTRRILELSLKPIFFVCCLSAIVLIYLLYRAVRIRKNVKNDEHVIQSNDSSKLILNEA